MYCTQLKVEENGSPITKQCFTTEELKRAHKLMEDKFTNVLLQHAGHSSQPQIYREYIEALQRMNNHLFELVTDADQEDILSQQKLAELKSDSHNLLQLIRHFCEHRTWNLDNLTFNRINVEELNKITSNELASRTFELKIKPERVTDQHTRNELDRMSAKIKDQEVEIDELKNLIKSLEDECKQLVSTGHVGVINDELDQFHISEETRLPQLENDKNKSIEDKIISENNRLQELVNVQEENITKLKESLSDKGALVNEITEKHDEVNRWKDKTRKSKEQAKHSKAQVVLREGTIKELRVTIRQLQKNISALSISPPKSPDPEQPDSCSSDLVHSFLIHKSNFLTVPKGHQAHSVDSYSLSDYSDQDQISAAVTPEIDCFHDHHPQGGECDRLCRIIFEKNNEIECLNILVTKLESQQHCLKKDLNRVKSDRYLQREKSTYLKFKMKQMENELMGGSDDLSITSDTRHFEDFQMLEDELKPETTILNNMQNVLQCSRREIDRIGEENLSLKKVIFDLKEDLEKSQNVNKQLREDLSEFRKCKCLDTCGDRLRKEEEVAKNYELVLKDILNSLQLLLGKDISVESISSSQSSGNPSGDDVSKNCISDLLEEWKKEVDQKNEQMSENVAKINQLVAELQAKDEEIVDMQRRCSSVESDKEKNDQTLNQLTSAVQTHKESIQYLKKVNQELQFKLEDSKKQLLNHHECFDEIKKRNKELDQESKNQLITISNLRLALEDLKRNESSSIKHSSEVIEALNLSISLLSEQLNQCFHENMEKDQQIEVLRDGNLEMRTNIHDLLEIVEVQKNRRTLQDLKKTKQESYKRAVQQLKDQEQEIVSELRNRERDINCLKNFRSKCVEIESEYLEKMALQKQKSDSTIKELETEITTLTEQLISSTQTNSHYEEMMKHSSLMQKSLQELEAQNDVLRKTIESYEGRFSDVQVQLEKIHFENGGLINEIEALKSDINDKNKRIAELSVNHHKLEAEYDMQKKSCNCSPKSSPEKRSSSAIMQMNDLKNKFMNKSVENTKLAEALKRKTQQLEKLQKTAFEEKNRLREECLKSIQIIGELKSRTSLLEMRVHEQNDELLLSRDKVNHVLSKMSSMETELQSKTSKLEDLETREERWRLHASEMTREVKSRNTDWYKREEKLMDELTIKDSMIKDHSKILQQNEHTILRFQEDNAVLRQNNDTLNKQSDQLREEITALRSKEHGLCDLLNKTEEELKAIRQEVFHVFNTNEMPQVKTDYSKMKDEHCDLRTNYESLVKEYNKLIDENRALLEIKNDTISAIEIFKKLQDESVDREKAYKSQIEKLTNDKRNLHFDRTKLTKQMVGMHRDMIILNSELDKFTDTRSHRSSYNSLQQTSFQQVFYPSDLNIARSNSNPDISEFDPIQIDVKHMTEKLNRTRKFWQHGIENAIKSIPTITQATTSS